MEIKLFFKEDILTNFPNWIAVKIFWLFSLYKSIDKFADFAAEKGENWAIETHFESKFPESDFKEDYYRFSKILIGVGDAKGADQSMGLNHELVALNNPYILSPSNEISVQLLFNDRPQKNRKITQ